MNTSHLLRLTTAFIAQSLIVSSVAAYQYIGIEIEPLPGNDSTVGHAVNNSGQVTGTSSNRDGGGPPSHGFLWDNGVLTDLGDLPGGANYSNAVDINDAGQIVGTSNSNKTDEGSIPISGAFFNRAFRWQSGSLINLGVTGLGAYRGMSINNSGQILTSTRELWDDGVITDLDDLPLSGSIVRLQDINDSAMMVGYGQPPPIPGSGTPVRGIVIEEGVVTMVDNLADESNPNLGVRLYAANNVGQVVGFRSSNGNLVPVLWESGTFLDLNNSPPGGHCIAHDINVGGQVVGSCSSDDTRTFIWDEENGFRSLDALVELPDGDVIVEAYGINDAGQIITRGSKGGFNRAYLLNPAPVPIPAAVWLFASAIAGIAFKRKKAA